MDTARCKFDYTKPSPTQNLNYQTHLLLVVSFNFFKKTHLQRFLTITKPTMAPNKFFAGFDI